MTIAPIAARHVTHGSFKENAIVMQATKELWRSQPNWGHLAPCQRECLDMIAHKIGRILHGDPAFKDHWIDIAGYCEATLKAMEEA